MRLKQQSAKKQLTKESAKLEDLTLKLADLDSARDCNKMWITSLKEQIRLMCMGQGITGRLVPMDKYDEAPSRSDAVLSFGHAMYAINTSKKRHSVLSHVAACITHFV